ncbi:MAG TPA: hypothetical protein DCM86_19200 [Verrucomicrobiales bacterium]|nr:hypothetical protein [Verrucomicrobiales bacterium]
MNIRPAQPTDAPEIPRLTGVIGYSTSPEVVVGRRDRPLSSVFSENLRPRRSNRLSNLNLAPMNPPIKWLLSLILAALASAGPLVAEPHKTYPAIDDTSSVEPGGDRVIRLAVDLKASPLEVWRTLTTAEGWRSYAVAFARMEMKVGGVIETSYNPAAKPGDPDNIRNEIVAYIPGRMLAIRCVQAPRDFKHKQEFFATSTVFELLPVEGGKTRMQLTAVGYRPGEAYDELFKSFRWGNAYTLEKLRALFDPPPPGQGRESSTSTKW